MLRALCVLSALFLGLAAAATGGKRTLVVLKNMDMQETHSEYFADLKHRGLELDFHAQGDSGVSLRAYGEWAYDNVILFAPKAKKFAGVTAAELLAFVDGGGNVLVGADSTVGSAVRDLASECGVDFDSQGSKVVDHFNYDLSDAEAAGDHSLVHGQVFTEATPVVGKLAGTHKANPVLFSGIGQAVNADNILAVRVLSGHGTSYSAFTDEAITDYPQSAGADTLLVTAVQARNAARVTFAGSLDMFSDDFFGRTPVNGAFKGAYDGNNNRYFCEVLTAWTFGERGILRFSDIRHTRADGSQPEVQLHEREQPDLPESLFPDPEIARSTLVYRVKDDLRYSIHVEQLLNGDWVPFSADDMQLEFVMLDAYVRTGLACDDDGTCSTVFKVPDTYGIYKLRVMYRRLGYSTVHSETQVSVRPFRHNEFERFIPAAFPYYASAFSMMAAFFIFGAAFLYTK